MLPDQVASSGLEPETEPSRPFGPTLGELLLPLTFLSQRKLSCSNVPFAWDWPTEDFNAVAGWLRFLIGIPSGSESLSESMAIGSEDDPGHGLKAQLLWLLCPVFNGCIFPLKSAEKPTGDFSLNFEVLENPLFSSWLTSNSELASKLMSFLSWLIARMLKPNNTTGLRVTKSRSHERRWLEKWLETSDFHNQRLAASFSISRWEG